MTIDTSKQLRNRRSLDGRRVKARLIDALIMVVPGIALLILLHPALGGSAFVIVVALEISYFFICEATWGATLGKHLMGLRVIRSDDGGSPKLGSVAARNVVRIVEEPFLALLVLVLSGGRRKRVGDFVGSTAVGSIVYSERPPKRRWTLVYPVLWVCAAIAAALLLLAPRERYLEQVNRICVEHQAKLSALDSPRFDFLVRLSRDETNAIAALDPPPGERDRHERIVELKRQLDAAALQTWREVNASPDPALAFRVAYSRLQEQVVPIETQLAELGLTCSA